MCVFDFLFSLPVLVAVAWRFCMTNAQPPKKEEELGATTLSLRSQNPNPPKKRIVSRGAVFSLCAFGLGCECVCVCVLRPFVVGFGCFRGHGCLCVCFLSQARARSLTFGSLTLSLSRSVSLSPLFLSLALSISDLHLSLITFTRKYYLLLCFVLLPLICNNSCILRDATVCVCCCVQYRKGRFALFACLPAACVYGFVFCLWSCDFVLLAIAQLVLLVCWGCWTFFLLLISCSFFFLLCVGVIRGMFQ